MIEIATSDSHPIYANLVDISDLKLLKGKLGLTFAPGKNHHGSISSKNWKRDVEKDLTRLKSEYNASTIVTLIEQFEFTNLKIENLRVKVKELGMKSIWFPIKDGDVPKEGYEIFDVFISYLLDLLIYEENLIIHCMGGLGRAGTVSSCILIKAGLNYKEALDRVRTTRKGAVENSHQEKYIEGYENYLKSNALIIKF
jgi:protein-tyrosine phosphatase